MPLRKEPLQAIQQFLPEHTFEKILPHLKAYPLHLVVSRDRKTVQGNYRPPLPNGRQHRISVNGNLNPYSFLITLLHELAHLYAFVQYGPKIAAHGSEWKKCFSLLLADFLAANIFPEAIRHALDRYLNNMKASTCTDPQLYKTLKKFDENKDDSKMFVEDIAEGKHFALPDGRVFQKLEKRRTRYKCIDVSSGHHYTFPGIAEVYPVQHL